MPGVGGGEGERKEDGKNGEALFTLGLIPVKAIMSQGDPLMRDPLQLRRHRDPLHRDYAVGRRQIHARRRNGLAVVNHARRVVDDLMLSGGGGGGADVLAG